ncbi:MAG: hypothetical protein ACRD8Z_27055, partial [Nitrososphaeraceae archaeon]
METSSSLSLLFPHVELYLTYCGSVQLLGINHIVQMLYILVVLGWVVGMGEEMNGIPLGFN